MRRAAEDGSLDGERGEPPPDEQEHHVGFLGRAHAEGTVALTLDEAATSVRRVAAHNGLTLDEGASTPTSLTFTKSVQVSPWGATVVIDLEPVQPSRTRLLISTTEKFAITDWGRGRRLAISMLDGLEALRPLSWSD
jgi:hypothetical protein